MFENCPYFFKDEWRVSVVDERVQQLLCVAEKESSSFLIQFAYLALNTA